MDIIGLKKSKYNTSPISYSDWISSVEGALLDPPREINTACCKISIILFAKETTFLALKKTVNSIVRQPCENWELFIITDLDIQHDLGGQHFPVTILCEEKVLNRNKYNSINKVALLAQGDLITFLDSGDLLSKWFVSSVIDNFCRGSEGKHGQATNVKVIYTDEDYLCEESNKSLAEKRLNPCFKPDWNPDYLENYNYLSKGVVYQRESFNKIGGFKSDVTSPFHELALSITQALTASQIRHIPQVLFHFNSPLENKKVNRLRYDLPLPMPFVTIIIPTKDKLELLKPCIEGVLENTDYLNLEVIIIDNNSHDVEVLDYLAALKIDARVSTIHYKKDFNFSDMNNQAVKRAKGDIICLLNNDISVLQKDWLLEMVSHASRPDIGCVGAKLYYPDGTIQHAGVILGLKGYASHAHKGFDGKSAGYCNRLVVTHNVSAVTAACLVVKKEIFNEVGGFDSENLKVAYNDVDFCLKVREAGYRNLFTPYAELIHHESKSRGKKRNKKNRQQLKEESNYLLKKWGELLFTDPAYNPNLTLLCEDFSLRLDRLNK